MKYSIVIVAHQTDYEALCLQARSMSNYLSSSLVEQIYLVENPKLENHEHLFDQFGDMKSYVTMIEAADIAPPETFRQSGWFSQQILKLLVSNVIETPRYLALDAKNTMVYPLKKKFLERNGAPLSHFVDFTHHTSIRWLRHTLDYFSLPDSYIGAFVPTVTPFVFVTDLVKEMIEVIEKHEGTPFPDAFLKYQLTEFFAYAGYLMATNQMSYNFNGKECRTIWDSVHSDEYVDECIRMTKQHKLPFFSVHRRAIPMMSPTSRRLVLEFWKSRGVDGSVIFK